MVLPDVSKVQVRASVVRILNSDGFVRCGELRRLLQYAVEEGVEGRAEQLKEYTLGVVVFRRGADFDPRIDPIVRVQARRMRDRLALYYEAEGLHDPIRIDFPKGSYAPIFAHRQPAELGEPAADRATPQTFWQRAARRLRSPLTLVAGVTLATFGAGTWFGLSLPRRQISPVKDTIPVAITQIQDMAHTPESAAVAKALTRELMSSLAKTATLRIESAPKSSTALLKGYVQVAGTQITVKVQLLHGRDHKTLWSGMYVRAPGSPASSANHIAGLIAARVAEVLGDDET